MPTLRGRRLVDYLGQRFSQRRGPSRAAQARLALPVLMLALTALPLLMMTYVRREDGRAAVQLADVNTGGSLRFRSVWLYGAGKRDAHIPLSARTAQRDTMQAIRSSLRTRYPADVAATDSAWARLETDFRQHGRVGWQSAQNMRDAADLLTRRIEGHAHAQAGHAGHLLLLGTCGLELSALGSLALLGRLRRSEDTLRRSEERLRTVVGNAPIVLFSLDAEGRFTASEGRGLELLGLAPGQVVGQSLFDYLGDNAVVSDHTRRALAGEAVSYVSHVAGHTWENQLRPVPGADGQGGIIGISFDVTDRHIAEEALRRGEERLRRLYEVTADAALSFAEKMDRLLAMGCAQFGLETGLLAEMDDTLFEVIHSHSSHGPDMAGLSCSPENTFCREAVRHGEPLGIEHIGGSAWAKHPAYHTWKPEAYLGTCVEVGGQPFGTLCFTGSRAHPVPFTTGDKDLLRLMAQWVGGEMQRREAEQQMRDYNVVLEFQKQEMERANTQLEDANTQLEDANTQLEQANTQLATLAATDALTGLCNRRALSDRLAAEFGRARRYGSPLSLLMMDVDQFKQYNDTFGHPAGDRVLRTVGHMLHDQARLTDLPARYGGEEFAVVLPETDALGALVAAERIRRALESHAWPLRPVTVSIGVCTLHSGLADADALLAAADSALYRSKAAGRNRVTHSDAPHESALSSAAAPKFAGCAA